VTRIAKKATLTEKQGAVLKEIVTSRTHRSDHRILKNSPTDKERD